MVRPIQHQLLAPDGQPLLVLNAEPAREGETIQAFIERVNWHFDLPTRCFVDGRVIRPGELTTIHIKAAHEIVIVSRPGLGGGSDGRPSTAKTIGSIVAMVALMVLAPYAGGALAGAMGLTGATIGGVAYSSIFAGFILAAGGALLSQFMKPKAAQPAASAKSLYSISASSNQARPLGMIPVGYGQRLRYPEYAAPPYSTFDGDDQFLYQLFCVGCGAYEPSRFLLDDTPWWTEEDGLNPAFADIKFQWVLPGEQVTLFPVNVTSASEVSGQRLPSPSKDPVRQGYLGPFIINPPETEAKEIWLDFVWPSGAGATRKGKEYPVNTSLLAEGRKVDGAGAPIGGESTPWVKLLQKTYSISTKVAHRITEKIPVDGGRWQVRTKRENDSYQDVTLDPDLQAHDDVSWTGARALIDGPQSFTGVTMLATVMKADAQTSGGTQNRIGVIARRRIEVFRDGLWQVAASRNPVDAAIDMWRNTDYSAGLSAANLVLPDLLYQRDAADARGDTFDHFFEDSISIQDAIETALRVIKANPAFIGDRLSVVRDEPKSPRMVFTDAEIVRGSLTIKRQLLDDTWADGVVVNYFDERTSRAASAPSAEGLLRPARVELPGISKAAQAADCAAYLAAVNRYRRRRVQFQCELEGRMLKRGDLVLIQSELPQTWGEGGEVRSYLNVNGVLQLTLDRQVTWQSGQPHFVLLRQRNGRPYGPIQVTSATASVIALSASDLALVEASQGSIYVQVLDREETEDPPSFSFSIGSSREYRGLVVAATMRDFVATIDTVIEAKEVYAATPGSVPPIPQMPAIFDKSLAPIVSRLSARAYQRGAGLFLSASWDPVVGAALYLAQVSIDGRATWAEAHRSSRTTFEIPMADVAVAWVRVACITPNGILCRFVERECEVPALSIDGDLFADLSITIEKLDAETKKAIADINDLGRGLLAYGADETRTELDLARDTIRGAIRQLASHQEVISETIVTQTQNAYEMRRVISVQIGAASAAIVREERARITENEALAELLDALEATIKDPEAGLEATALALSRLTTTVETQGGDISSLSEDVVALETVVNDESTGVVATGTALSELTTRTETVEGQVKTASENLTDLSGRIDDPQLGLSATAQATQSLKIVVEDEDTGLAATARFAQTLSTKVGEHTTAITETADSVAGIQAQYGVAIEVDGEDAGGFVLRGFRQLDGSLAATFRIDADVFARSITSPLLQTTKLIATSAQIGNLVVDNIHVKDGGISSMVSNSNSGKTVSVSISVRTAGKIAIKMGRVGNAGQRWPPTFYQSGNFQLRRNGALIYEVPAAVAFQWDPAAGGNYFVIINGSVFMDDTPGAGTHTYELTDTNNTTVGGVYLSVEESK